MAWYNPFENTAYETVEKLNPGQQYLGTMLNHSRENTLVTSVPTKNLEIVNRGVNMIVDDVAEIPTIVKPSQRQEYC